MWLLSGGTNLRLRDALQPQPLMVEPYLPQSRPDELHRTRHQMLYLYNI
jgi:hypothetical protein